jgi:hypothetical protein
MGGAANMVALRVLLPCARIAAMTAGLIREGSLAASSAACSRAWVETCIAWIASRRDCPIRIVLSAMLAESVVECCVLYGASVTWEQVVDSAIVDCALVPSSFSGGAGCCLVGNTSCSSCGVPMSSCCCAFCGSAESACSADVPLDVASPPGTYDDPGILYIGEHYR